MASGHNNRVDTWHEKIPPTLLPAVRGVAIVHIAKTWSLFGAATAVGTVMSGASELLGRTIGHASSEVGTALGQIVNISATDTAVGVTELKKIATGVGKAIH